LKRRGTDKLLGGRSLASKIPFLLRPNRSIHAKLLVFFLIVALIPVLSLGMYSIKKSSEVINDQIGAYGSYAITQLKLQLDSNLTRMEYLANDIVAYLSNSSIRLPDAEPVKYRHFKEANALKRYLANYSPDEWGMLITKSGMVYGGNDALQYDRLARENWWQAHSQATKGRIWIGFHPASYYNESSRKDKLISLLAPVNESFNVPDGTKILVEMDANPLINLFNSFERDTGTYLKITDIQGNLIYETVSDFMPRPDDRVWTDQLETNGWMIEARMAKEQFFESSNVTRRYLLVTAMVSLIIALVCAEIFSSSVTKRIRRLSNSMNEAGLGNLSVRNSDESKDELGVLSRHFNRMIQKIQILIEDISRIEKQKKEADIRVLHYQINPHVLFNTLNTIQWKARLTGQKEIEKMLVHLIAMLGESLRYKDEIVPLRRELEMAEHFLAIQRFRFGDVFHYSVSVDERLLDASIPRMTLQPLFENIFFHAFEDGKGCIRLVVKEDEDGNVVLELSDNGKGMTKSQAAGICQSKPAGMHGGLGLSNVNQKIMLHFGNRYGMKVESQPGNGTKITIVLPGEGGQASGGKNQSIDCG